MDIHRQSMNNGVYGPNAVGHTYMPKKEHSYKAVRKPGKTRWIRDKNFEYFVFNLADEHANKVINEETMLLDKRWMNDDGRGLFSIVDNGNETLGENGERLAFFPTTQNDNDPWHGYPVDSTYIMDELIDHWYNMGIIDSRIYSKLLNHSL